MYRAKNLSSLTHRKDLLTRPLTHCLRTQCQLARQQIGVKMVLNLSQPLTPRFLWQGPNEGNQFSAWLICVHMCSPILTPDLLERHWGSSENKVSKNKMVYYGLFSSIRYWQSWFILIHWNPTFFFPIIIQWFIPAKTAIFSGIQKLSSVFFTGLVCLDTTRLLHSHHPPCRLLGMLQVIRRRPGPDRPSRHDSGNPVAETRVPCVWPIPFMGKSIEKGDGIKFVDN